MEMQQPLQNAGGEFGCHRMKGVLIHARRGDRWQVSSGFWPTDAGRQPPMVRLSLPN